MLAQLINRPCTITHKSVGTETDRYGNEIPATEEIETVCEVQQSVRSLAGRASEPATEGELSDTEWMGAFLADTALGSADTVNVPGLGGFEVVGEPWPARNPRTGVVVFVQAALHRTVGPDEEGAA
jgi:hypothetical protein